MELTVTAKIRIYPSNKQILILKDTMHQIRKELNYVSEYIYNNNCLVQRKSMMLYTTTLDKNSVLNLPCLMNKLSDSHQIKDFGYLLI